MRSSEQLARELRGIYKRRHIVESDLAVIEGAADVLQDLADTQTRALRGRANDFNDREPILQRGKA